jgi:hypothetical protein
VVERVGVEGIALEDILVDGLAANQMLLDDALENLRSSGVVPGPFGVDDGYRALLADAQAVDLAAVDAAVAGGQAEFS